MTNGSKLAVGLVAIAVLVLGGLAINKNNKKNDDKMTKTETSTTQMAKVEAPKNIVGVAVDTSSLSTLVAAVKAASLVDTLSSKDSMFTVFAPTNEAFAALPEGTLTDLLKPENKAKLASILTYHVVAGKVMAADLKDGQMVKTVQGQELKVTLKDGKAYVGGAEVLKADVPASNGVVHVINAVLLPS